MMGIVQLCVQHVNPLIAVVRLSSTCLGAITVFPRAPGGEADNP